MQTDNTSDSTYLGGLNMNELIFNYHPIFMVSGLIVGFTCSLTSFRLLPVTHKYSKYIHATLHTLTVILIVLGLSAVFIGNNYKSKNTADSYFANLYTLHSFLGLSAITLYSSNYIIGLITFLFYDRFKISIEWRRRIKPYHILFGIFTLFAAVFAVETGVMELSTEIGCYYEVTNADLNPVENYHKLGGGCQVANGIGMTVFLVALFAFFSVYDVQQDPVDPNEYVSEEKEPILKPRAYVPPSIDSVDNNGLRESLLVLGLTADTKI